MKKNLTPNHFDTAGIYVEGERSVFSFKKPVLASFMAGTLNPLGDPLAVFPGVKLDLVIDSVIRSNTMVVPPLDGIFVDYFTVWVPHRIVWNHMPQFLGDNDATAWTQSASYVYPYVAYVDLLSDGNSGSLLELLDSNALDASVSFGNLSLTDKYGLINMDVIASSNSVLKNKKINILAYRGYYSIWNYLFRDENYQRPVLFSKGDTGSSGEFGYLLRNYEIDNSVYLSSIGFSLGSGLPADSAVLMPVNKFHDAFTSVLPQAQFDNGSGVSLPLGSTAPVFGTLDTGTVASGYKDLFAHLSGSSIDGFRLNSSSDGNTVSLKADLANATAAPINALRTAVMTQRYLEALARGGRRNTEFYSAIYGVSESSVKCDYPQLISRARYQLGVKQVVATADAGGSGWTSHLGDTGAYSLTVLRNIPCCERDFSEFGYLHILYCVRSENRYSQIIQPHFLKSELLQEYNPFFDHIGDVDLYNGIVNTSAATSGNFGFQEAWWDERTQLAMATGALNKHYGSLSYWILGENFASSVTSCTPGFLTFDPATLNDIFVSAYYAYPQFIMDACIRGKKVARMSQHSIPGIVGRI